MQHKALSSALLLAGSMMFSASSAFAADPAMLGNTCAGCHGTNGSSVGPATPTIAGMAKETIVAAMEAYKTDDRPSTIMGRIAKGYSPEEIEAMAEFFSKQKMVRFPQETDAAQVDKGKRLHDKYCEKCHEDGGRIDDETSILAGQWMPYLTFSLEDFNSGARDMPKKMKKKLDEMVEKEGAEGLRSIVHYYGSQK